MANEPKYTDREILEAFEKGPRSSLDKNVEGIAKLLDGKPSNAERISDRAIAEAFDGKDVAVMGSGKIRESDKDGLWLNQLSIETAAESLRLAFMAKNPGMQAREVGNAADAKLLEFYTEAARNTPYEATRLDYVQHQAKKLTNELRGSK